MAPRFPRALWLGVAVLLLPGCASTKLTEQWKEPAHQGPAFKKILVFGVTDSPTQRRTFEDEFAKQLDARAGVDGVPSHTLFPTEAAPDKDEVKRVLEEQGFDAAMATRLIGEQTNVHYNPGSRIYPYPYYGGFYDYYWHAYAEVRTPGYITTSTTVKLETNVYEAEKGELVWAGVTETFQPGKLEKVVDDLAKVILKSMTEFGMI